MKISDAKNVPWQAGRGTGKADRSVKGNGKGASFAGKEEKVSLLTGRDIKASSFAGKEEEKQNVTAALTEEQQADFQAQGVRYDGSVDVDLEYWKKQMDQMRESSKNQSERDMELAKVLTVARRIARGDKVPAKDEKKLMEYNFKLYMMSKNAAMMSTAKKRKKYKSLWKEDEEKERLRHQLEDEKNDTLQGTESGTAAGAGSTSADLPENTSDITENIPDVTENTSGDGFGF